MFNVWDICINCVSGNVFISPKYIECWERRFISLLEVSAEGKTCISCACVHGVFDNLQWEVKKILSVFFIINLGRSDLRMINIVVSLRLRNSSWSSVMEAKIWRSGS